MIALSGPGVPSNGTPRSRARTVFFSDVDLAGGEVCGSRPWASSTSKTAWAQIKFDMNNQSQIHTRLSGRLSESVEKQLMDYKDQAKKKRKDFENVMYIWGSATQIPWEENFFDKMLSVESFYYYPDQDRALAELFRVLAPKGRMFILINLYKDNHYSLRWVTELKVPVQALSEAEYKALLEKHGFKNVEARRIPDRSRTPETYSGKWFKNAEELRDFKKIGALLLIAEKAL